jgi:hypothetical protein
MTLIIDSSVLAEVIYVLTSPRLGGHARDRVSNVLRDVFGLEGVEMMELDATLRATSRRTRPDSSDGGLMKLSNRRRTVHRPMANSASGLPCCA